MDSSDQQLAIIGGGITGLTAAYEAVLRGATQVHVYESAARLGGKIESGQLNGTTINRGAEFIDSEHAVLRGLCQAMDVPLVENRGMAQECFQRPNGALMSSEDFYAAYKPYAEQIILDRAELTSNPTSERAQTIRQQSLADYLAHLQKTVPPAPRSIWDAVKDTALLRGHASATALAIASDLLPKFSPVVSRGLHGYISA
jgi:phytoene dehydrogenase-like protein